MGLSEVSDTEAFLDPDASRAYLSSWKDRVDQMAARTQSMADQMGQLRTTAEDGNGLARVTIDASGVLLHLELTERTRRYQPDVVASAVMAALRQARMQAAERAREIAVETMGPDSLSARAIADRMQQLLEAPESGDDVSGGER